MKNYSFNIRSILGQYFITLKSTYILVATGC
jgi:hypothetical protein